MREWAEPERSEGRPTDSGADDHPNGMGCAALPVDGCVAGASQRRRQPEHPGDRLRTSGEWMSRFGGNAGDRE